MALGKPAGNRNRARHVPVEYRIENGVLITMDRVEGLELTYSSQENYSIVALQSIVRPAPTVWDTRSAS